MKLSLNQKGKLQLSLSQQSIASLHVLEASQAEVDSLIEEYTLLNPCLEKKDKPCGHEKHFDTGTTKLDLKSHLFEQILLSKWDQNEQKIGQFLIDAIDNRGFCEVSFIDIQKAMLPEITVSSKQIEEVLKKLQGLDPAGIAARNLPESLSNQFKTRYKNEPLFKQALAMIDHHLDWVAEKKYDKICLKLGLTKKEVSKLIDKIKSLTPYPGVHFDVPASDHYIIPDLLMDNKHTGIHIRLNCATFDSLKLNIKAKKKHQSEFEAAKMLIANIKKRNETLLKITHCLVEYQHAYFQETNSTLLPLDLKTIAQKTALHISTVSRAIANKYIQTPNETLALKSLLCSSGAKTSKIFSQIAIQTKLKNVIDSEDKKKPLSDTALCELLAKEAIYISRRTVCKYRERLKILPAKQRRSM